MKRHFLITTTPLIQILIYGGSTAVGHFAIQLARLSGFRVVTTASPRNHGLMRRLGAKAVFNVRNFLFIFGAPSSDFTF